jgi:hypothetical protein
MLFVNFSVTLYMNTERIGKLDNRCWWLFMQSSAFIESRWRLRRFFLHLQFLGVDAIVIQPAWFTLKHVGMVRMLVTAVHHACMFHDNMVNALLLYIFSDMTGPAAGPELSRRQSEHAVWSVDESEKAKLTIGLRRIESSHCRAVLILTAASICR